MIETYEVMCTEVPTFIDSKSSVLIVSLLQKESS
jgi:hypothetical protein